MPASRFYVTDSGDPAAPVALAEYTGPYYGTIRPGDRVTYDNPAAQWLGNPTPDGAPMTVTELLRFPALPGREDEYTAAVLDDGQYECAADHLRLLPLAEFPSIEAFYDDRPERRTSGEADYGVHWQVNGRPWPQWRVSYVQATGEVYAVERGAGPVRVLGVVPPDDLEACRACREERAIHDPDYQFPVDHPFQRGTYYRTLDKILDGWADPDVSGFDLAWIERKLAEHARAE